mgnify:CR=1 FL=1
MSVPTNISSVVRLANRSVLEGYARALIEFADAKPFFAHTLYFLSEDLKRSRSDYVTRSTLPQTRWLLPRDEIHAEQRARWLLSEIELRPEASAAHAIILDWREHFAPQEFVIGIVGLAVMGPTMGIIDSKKKPKSQLPVVLTRHQLRTLASRHLCEVVQRASVGLLAKELQMVGGNAYRLEPDLAEWCFSDQPTRLCTVESAKRLDEVHATLRTEGLPYYALANAERALAISPSVSPQLLDHLGVHSVSEAEEV